MIYDPAPMAIVVFLLFVVGTVALSFYLGRRANSSEGYFAAHGQIPWFVNGVAFAGDYLSAASFLGICGMIAAYGYDGFLYSIDMLIPIVEFSKKYYTESYALQSYPAELYFFFHELMGYLLAFMVASGLSKLARENR